MQSCRWDICNTERRWTVSGSINANLSSRHQNCILWNKSTMKQWVKRLTPAHVMFMHFRTVLMLAWGLLITAYITCRVAIPATEPHSQLDCCRGRGTLYFICISCWVENKTLWSSAIKVLPICNVLVTNPLSPYNNWVYGIIIWPNINKNKLSIGHWRNKREPNKTEHNTDRSQRSRWCGK